MLKSYPEHLVFASHEMTPNITPAIDHRMGVKKIWIAHTSDMLDRAERLASIYKNHQLEVGFISLTTVFDALLLINELTQACQQFQIEHAKLAVNISCGTKISAVAAVKAFENTDAGIYYLLPNDDLDWIQPTTQPVINLEDNIQIDEMLQAYGVDYVRVDKLSAAHAEFANAVSRGLKRFIFEPHLHEDFQDFSHKVFRNQPVEIHRKHRDFLQFIQFLNQAGHVRLKKHADLIRVSYHFDHWHRMFLHGGWLEFMVFKTVQNLKSEIPQIQDVAMGVHSHRDKVQDEVDVLFLCNNQLFIIECKTGGTANFNHHVQRLDSLKKRLGGVLSHAMYITNNLIKEDGGDAHKAKALGVHYISRNQLKSLKHHLKSWIKSKL